ncbi:MAG: efflux RND transporter permease subunit, partial [Betaproteobacteria bacterium]|nr:efflux RND transporter permease subunit [Betaproteobacteria bacterium]
KFTRSYSRAGESLIVLELLDTAPAAEVPQIWYQVRKKLGDIRGQLPADLMGPYFNDEFGDVFGSIWAFTADGYSLAELRREVEQVRQSLLRIPDVSKIELIGLQDEKIYIEIDSTKLAALGLDPSQLIAQLQAQNVISPSGVVHGPALSIPLRVSGGFDSVASIEKLAIFIRYPHNSRRSTPACLQAIASRVAALARPLPQDLIPPQATFPPTIQRGLRTGKTAFQSPPYPAHRARNLRG